MTDNEIKKAFDILDKFDFFGGQRAGRELWNEKPVDVQNEDIENFSKDVAFLKDLINSLQAENERLQDLLKRHKRNTDRIRMINTETAKSIKAEAYKEFAERLKEISHPYADTQMVFELQIDNLLKKMVGEDNA